MLNFFIMTQNRKKRKKEALFQHVNEAINLIRESLLLLSDENDDAKKKLLDALKCLSNINKIISKKT